MKKIIQALILTSLLASIGILSGCNTVRGVGQDVSASGNALANTADQHQDY